MKKYLIFILAIIGIAACKRKEPAPNYCYSASDHPDIREKFTVNGVDSIFTKNGSGSNYKEITDTFIIIDHTYVDRNCLKHYSMIFGEINKYLKGKQTLYYSPSCETQVPGACKSNGFFATIDEDNLFETFYVLEGADPSQNWVEITSIDSARIKGNYDVTFLRDNNDLDDNSSFMNADTLHITGSFDVPNPG